MKVFLTYAMEDRHWAWDLSSKLKKAGFQIQDPYSRLFPGDNVPLEVGKALQSSNAMIALVSPEAAASEMFRYEVSYAVRGTKFRNKLIPVIIRPTSKMPWVLSLLRPERGSPKEVSKRIITRLKADGAVAA